MSILSLELTNIYKNKKHSFKSFDDFKNSIMRIKSIQTDFIYCINQYEHLYKNIEEVIKFLIDVRDCKTSFHKIIDLLNHGYFNSISTVVNTIKDIENYGGLCDLDLAIEVIETNLYHCLEDFNTDYFINGETTFYYDKKQALDVLRDRYDVNDDFDEKLLLNWADYLEKLSNNVYYEKR